MPPKQYDQRVKPSTNSPSGYKKEQSHRKTVTDVRQGVRSLRRGDQRVPEPGR